MKTEWLMLRRCINLASLIGSMLKNDKQLNDQAIANDMLMGSKAGASMYLAAILESSTPEIRAMYSSALNQMIAGHSALTDLAVARGWYKPYDIPEQQLVDTFRQSETLVKPAEM